MEVNGAACGGAATKSLLWLRIAWLLVCLQSIPLVTCQDSGELFFCMLDLFKAHLLKVGLQVF